jgi:hypothetical protein
MDRKQTVAGHTYTVNLEFDWQVGDKQDQQETLAHIARRRRRAPRWVWLVVAIVAGSLAAGGYILLRQRYDEAKARAAFQIQGVIDLEASAYARGDAELFLEQQDRAAPGWYADQAIRISEDCLAVVTAQRDAAAAGGSSTDLYRCEPVLPASVQELELRRDVAWVEVIEGEPPARRVRFYRQTDLGWRQTAPQAEFWATAIELRYGDDLVFRFYRRDRPHVQPAIDRIVAAFDQTCATFRCASEAPIEVNFVVDMPRLKRSELQNGAILVPSPWLAGIPVDGAQAPYIAGYAYLVAHELTSAHLRTSTGRPLTPFEAAMADEYAAWQSGSTAGHAPIVDRLVERRGADALPTIFASLQDVGSLNLLLVEWLGLSASTTPSAYFEALVNLEQQALVAGRRGTFLLLQDETVPGWLAGQEAFFDLAQTQDLSIEPARVQGVDVSGELARVTLERPTALAGAHPLAPRGQIVYFRREGGDWKHTSPRFTQVETTRSALLPALADAGRAVPAHIGLGGTRSKLASLARATGSGQTTSTSQVT